MASVVNEGGGHHRLDVVCPDGVRRKLRLGNISKKSADGIAVHVKHLVATTISGQAPDDADSRWLAALSDRMHSRVSRLGISAPRLAGKRTLAAFIDEYIADRSDVKSRTIDRLNETRERLVKFFSADQPLRSVTPGDAESFRRHLLKSVGDNTARRICGRAKQFFTAAIKKRLVQENPFAGIKCRVQPNRKRWFTVTRQMLAVVLEACPDDEWRLLVMLSRIGGLRVTSETDALRWADIKWDEPLIRVNSPKTEHIAGKAYRDIPLFPELLQPLLEAFSKAPYGSEYVLTRHRGSDTNLRTQFGRIIERAGLEQWPQVFHNLRRTRQNELERVHGLAVACEWIGNSESVARENYLGATKADFARAVGANPQAAQKAAQQGAELACVGSQSPAMQKQNRPVLPGDSTPCESEQDSAIPPRGVEPLSSG
jgi:integrase